ncbi:lysophospholipase [Kalaharituber pfeilii]|nr:lysophospholipase [Kalaharituber pfeilii]
MERAVQYTPILEHGGSASLTSARKHCPSATDYVRPAPDGIDPSEQRYISAHSAVIGDSLRPFAIAAGLRGGQADSIFRSESLRPITAIALSGGSYRAMLNGASTFRALDNRSSNVPEFSGLLQGMDYMVGLSGGNWLVGSSALDNFATMEDLRNNHWELEKGLVTGVKGNPEDHVNGVLKYLAQIKRQVEQKSRVGFETTLTDYWSLALGRQLVNRTTGAPNVLWSQIEDKSFFSCHEMPFPISISTCRLLGEKVVERTSDILETTPYSFGSWDRAVSYFFPTKYLGTSMQGGSPKDAKDGCMTGFDVGAFVMGTSSSLFSGILARIWQRKAQERKEHDGVFSHLTKGLQELLADVLAKALGGNEDIAHVIPEPILRLHHQLIHSNLSQNQSSLFLADGGLDNQNIPFWPLLQPSRHVDFILAVDSSADTHQHWPNGSSLVATRSRTQSLLSKYFSGNIGVVPFPYVPSDGSLWAQQGMNYQPVFFGCSKGNYTSNGNNKTVPKDFFDPLIVYLPNVPWTYFTNTSTFELDYTPEEVSGFFANGARQVAQTTNTNWETGLLNSTETVSWKVCVGCAIFQRSKERAGIVLGGVCEDCFDRYCWGGGQTSIFLLTTTKD